MALPMALIAAVAAAPASAQSAIPTSGDVGSAASRSGYPAAGGAIVLPALPASGTATTTATGAGSVTSAAAASGSLASGSGGGGKAGTVSPGGAAPSSGVGGGAHWVLCPPAGSTGLLPLFTGTDLSCTPD